MESYGWTINVIEQVEEWGSGWPIGDADDYDLDYDDYSHNKFDEMFDDDY